MRYCASLLLLFTMIVSCSKKNNERINFAEIAVDGKTFAFDSLKAVVDTSSQANQANFTVYDRATNSYLTWETLSGATKWINGIYEFPGQLYPGRSVVFMHLQTYVNRVPGSYSVQNNGLTMTIDQSENGRIHGTFSGKMKCFTCTPYGIEVSINGEFEMPYTFR